MFQSSKSSWARRRNELSIRIFLLQRDEDKILAREKQKAAHQAASLGLPDPSLVALANSANPYGTLGDDDDDDDKDSLDEDSDDDVKDANGVSSSLKLHAKSLKEVISKSDIIVQVLDARDPEGTRSRKIEREVIQVHGKKLVMVMNKIGAFSTIRARVLG
jgi:nuclear GTP-binding protein